MTDSEEVQTAQEAGKETNNHANGEVEAATKDSHNGNKEEQEEREDDAGSENDDDSPIIGEVPDISNLSLKHPLQNSWVLWYDNPGKRTNQNSWGDYLKKVTTFDTVCRLLCVISVCLPSFTGRGFLEVYTLALALGYHFLITFKQNIQQY